MQIQMKDNPKVCIFVGPSLHENAVKSVLPDALVLPPCELGDVDFARYQLGATTIGIIDGRHTHVLPICHKEILSVLQDGCRVIGAASMGALRAVECEAFGAEPVGEVARMYQSGEIDADDEVCLAHADKESGYKHLSEPMVNIRATIKNADINDDLKQEIIDYARNLYYPDREWQNIFEACDVGDEEIRLIHDAYCDIKEADSLHLCYKISSHSAKSGATKKIYNAHCGFAATFENNDRKIISEGKVVRTYEIADQASSYDRMNARNRALALELCKILGLSRGVIGDGYINKMDLTQKENKDLVQQELWLNTAGEWIASRASGADIVKSINDYLRISGRYDKTKESI